MVGIALEEIPKECGKDTAEDEEEGKIGKEHKASGIFRR